MRRKIMDMKWTRKGKKKLWVDIPQELYDQLKNSSQKRNITFTKYINRILMRFILEENKYDYK